MITTTFKEGFVAQEDIVVYKQLKRFYNYMWITSWENYEVTLDSELLPKGSPEIKVNKHNCEIQSGVIYSNTEVVESEEEDDDEYYFKSIIPKGSRFWLNDTLSDIVSEKLYITSDKAEPGDKTDLGFLYLPHCLDLLTKDNWRVSWNSEVSPEDIKGIYVYDSQAVSLRPYYSMYTIFEPHPDMPNPIDSHEEAENDFSGRERTRYLRRYHPDLVVLKDLPEDSYIPACGELLEALKNFLLINLTRRALGLKSIDNYWIWSSTPYSRCHMWYIRPAGFTDWEARRYFSSTNRFNVLPFLK